MGAYLFVDESTGKGDLNGLHENLNVAGQTDGLTAAGLRGIIHFWTILGLWAFIARGRPMRILFQQAIETISLAKSPVRTDCPRIILPALKIGYVWAVART